MLGHRLRRAERHLPVHEGHHAQVPGLPCRPRLPLLGNLQLRRAWDKVDEARRNIDALKQQLANLEGDGGASPSEARTAARKRIDDAEAGLPNVIDLAREEIKAPFELIGRLVTGGATASLSMAAVGLSMNDRSMKPVGYVALGAGAVLGTLAVYLFLDEPSNARPSRVTITPSSSKLMAHWTTTF